MLPARLFSSRHSAADADVPGVPCSAGEMWGSTPLLYKDALWGLSALLCSSSSSPDVSNAAHIHSVPSTSLLLAARLSFGLLGRLGLGQMQAHV